MSIQLGDFQLVNRWTEYENGEQFTSGEPKFVIDETTERLYLNESKGVVGFKCFLLIFGTPIVHGIASLVNVAYRILKLVLLSHFWMPKEDEESYNFCARLKDAGADFARIFTQYLSLFVLELSAIYGLFRPYDARKLYATIERGQYGNFILAPCFQPRATRHFFGGDIDAKDAF